MVLAQGTGAVLLGLGLALSAGAEDVQGRIDAAAPGSTVEVGPGVHVGALVIDKPLTLRGRDMPRIDGGGSGHVIAVRADEVTIRGFEIAGSGTDLRQDQAGVHVTGDRATIAGNRIVDALHGVYLKKTEGCRVLRNEIRGKTQLRPSGMPETGRITADMSEMCSPLNVHSRGNGIHLWNSREAVLDGNEITDTRDGMYFSFSNRCTVRGNRIIGVRYGLHYMYSDHNRFEGNTFSDNAAGAAIMYSKGLDVRGNRFTANRGGRAYGLLLNSVDATRIERNVIRANTVGIYLENNNNNILVGNDITRNYVGVRMTASSNDNAFSANRFGGNMHPVELAGQNPSNRWAIDGVGNRWEDSAPVDLDGDGVGELPHREVDLLGDLRRDLPAVGLLSESPGLGLLEFAHRHVALPGVAGIEDPAPLTSTPAAP